MNIHTPERVTLLDKPDRKLVMVGRGLGLSETIGREILALAGTEGKPNVLIVPSPASTQKKHDKSVADAAVTFSRLGASTDTLHAFSELPSAEQIADKLGAAHAAWIIGGNSQIAMDIFKTSGFDQALVDSEHKVISGGSAGMVVQTKESMSWYTPVGKPEDNAMVGIDGLGIARITGSPHLDYIERDDGLTLPRSDYFRKFITDPEQSAMGREANPALPAIGVDDAAALVINGDTYRVLRQDNAAENVGVTAYFKHGQEITEVNHRPDLTYAPISWLINA